MWRRAALAAGSASARQIAKDLDVIRHGLCLELASGQDGYAFARAPQLPAVTFSFGEALAIYLAADAVRMVPGVDTTELQVALTRLGGALPVEFQQVMERRTRNALPVQTQVGQRRTALLPVLHAAMFWGRILTVKYASATRGGEVNERRVRPYAVFPHGRAWYLAAYCELRQAVLVFKVDRIQEAVLTEDRYTVPESFGLEDYMGSAWGIIRDEEATAEDVSLRFDAKAGRWVAEEYWHRTQEIEMLEDGGIRFRVSVPPTPELTRWVLSYGRHVQVEAPDRLRGAVLAEAEATVSSMQRQVGQP